MLNPLLNGKQEKPIYELINSLGTKTTEVISQWLVVKLAERLDCSIEEIDTVTDFSDYGLNSIEAVNLSGELENFLGCRLPPTLLWDYPTVEELAQYLAKDYVSPKINPVNPDKDTATAHIPPEYYRLELFPEYLQLDAQLEEITSLAGTNPFFRKQQGIVNERTIIDNQELINYANYNYVGLCGHPAIAQAAKDAIDRYGTSASASRLISGEKPIHQELEREIADFLGTEDSIVYVGGHATNVTTISHLFGAKDLIFYDELSHNSIVQGCLLSGATMVAFPHNDWQALDTMLAERRSQFQRVLIVIEGVYSTDGDIPDLPQFITLKQKYKTFLMVDEAHSLGVLGATGRGIGELFAVNPQDVDLWMGTLSKSCAGCGGYIAGSQSLVKYLKYSAPGFVYSVGISPPNAAASLTALRILKNEPQRVQRLQEIAQLFLDLAKAAGINTGMSKGSPIIPVILGDSLKAVQLSQNLFARGINVPFMIHPSVPKDKARLRFFVTSTHTDQQIHFTMAILQEELAKL